APPAQRAGAARRRGRGDGRRRGDDPHHGLRPRGAQTIVRALVRGFCARAPRRGGRMTAANIFADLAGDPSREQFTDLVHAGDVRIERIVSHGQASPPGFWYDQDWAEWVLVLQGSAGVRLESEAGRRGAAGRFLPPPPPPPPPPRRAHDPGPPGS